MEHLRIPYHELQNNPLDRNRYSTDKFCTYLFGFFLIVWLFLTLHVLSAQKSIGMTEKTTPHVSSGFDDGSFENDQFRYRYGSNGYQSESHSSYGPSDEISKLFQNRFTITLGALSVLVIVLSFIRFLEWDCRVCIHIAVIFQILSNILPLFPVTLGAFQMISRNYKDELFAAAIIIASSLAFWILNAVSIQSIRSIIVDDLEKLIKKSIQAIMFYPSLIFFTLCILTLEILVAVVISGASNSTYNDSVKSVSIWGSLYVGHCVWLFGKMVIAGATASWHWKSDQEGVPLTKILKTMVIVIRYHLGTLLFGGTWILPILTSAYTANKYRFNGIQNYSSPVTEKVCRFLIIFRASDYALISSVVNGINFSESIRSCFENLTKNSPMTVALFSVTTNILITACPFIFLSTSSSLALLLSALQANVSEDPKILEVSLFLTYATAIQLILVVSASMETTYLISLKTKTRDDIAECIPSANDQSV